MTDINIIILPENRVVEAAELAGGLLGYGARGIEGLKPRLAGKLNRHFRVCAAVREDSTLAGIVSWAREGSDAECSIFHLAVAKVFQGQKIGAALMRHAEALAGIECLGGKPGIMSVMDDTEKRPDAEMGFYEKLGYLESGSKKIKQLNCLL